MSRRLRVQSILMEVLGIQWEGVIEPGASGRFIFHCDANMGTPEARRNTRPKYRVGEKFSMGKIPSGKI